jgi:hypothetical protein
MHPRAIALEQRQAGCRVMPEAGFSLLLSQRQSNPHLDAFDHGALRTDVGGDALRVYDAAACGHPVHGTGLDALLATQAVAMHHRAGE